jgi:aminoglycoside phosphotransferase family enzyme/predicted kinase
MPLRGPSEANIVAFLSDPATHGGAPVERISTHAAHIFLAGEYAFKLKRAVKLPFLDFSTAKKRRSMLEQELALNRVTAPRLYLEVRDIYEGPDHQPTFTACGGPIDSVLVMRRFPQEALLDNIARRGALTAAMMDSLAACLASMHRNAQIVREPVSRAFKEMALDNFNALRDADVDQGVVETARTELHDAVATLASEIDERARTGFSRRCHGDLHLGNIVLLEGTPTPFDALEFDSTLATGDVYYDLAFLLMDLDHRGLRPMANRLLSRYVQLTDDYEGLRALPLYLSVRAAIRAKVAAIAFKQDSAQSSLEAARSYLAQAEGYLPPPSPWLIAVGGLSGTGKSVLAQALAPDFGPSPGALVLRSDSFRKHLCGVAETTWLPRDAYTSDLSARVYDALMDAARRSLESRWTVIVDAVFAREEERRRVESIATECGAGFAGLWLEAPLDVRTSRVRTRVSDASDADSAIVEMQSHYDIGQVSWRRCDASGSKEALLATARSQLSLTLRERTASPRKCGFR